MTRTVVGIFNSANEAQDAVDKLIDDGFNNSHVDYADAGDYYKNDTDDNESGIARFFRNLFGDNDSDKYSRAARNRHIVTVHATSDDEARRASVLLDEYGAIDVDEDSAGYSGTGVYDDSINTRNKVEDDNYDFDNTDESRKIPVIEENLNVDKKVVQTGGVRLRSRIIEKPVEETIRLRKERVTVDRRNVDRPLTDDDLDNFKEETIEVRERAEVPVVRKDARVVEEIDINKTVDEEHETVSDTVKRRDVEIEDFGKKDL